MDKFFLLAPLWACADLAAAAADVAKLRNHPAYARLGLVQSACGRWLVCRVLPLPEDDGGALCAATGCGLPETPAEDVCAGCGRSDGRTAPDMRLAAAACSSAADVCLSIGGTAAPCGLPETAADAFGSNGKAFPADGLPESVFGDGWRPARGVGMNPVRIGLNDVKAAAYGRWPEILQSLGVPAALLDKSKHQPCPACGGKDRFRFTNHKQGGGFICNHCSPDGGSGFDLLMLVYGYTFAEAVQAVKAVLGLAGGHVAPMVAKAKPAADHTAEEAERNRCRLAKLWDECLLWNAQPVIADYLHGRGIPLPEALPVSSALRFHPHLAYWHGKRLLGCFPAMVGLYRDAEGQPCGLHITYLAAAAGRTTGKAVLFDPKTRERLQAKKMRAVHSGSLTGAAIRLFTPETAVSAFAKG